MSNQRLRQIQSLKPIHLGRAVFVFDMYSKQSPLVIKSRFLMGNMIMKVVQSPTRNNHNIQVFETSDMKHASADIVALHLLLQASFQE